MTVNELTRTDGGENNSSYLAKLHLFFCLIKVILHVPLLLLNDYLKES